MAKLGKAARGKQRWIGLQISSSVGDKQELTKLLSEITQLGDKWKLYDMVRNTAIIRIPLEDYIAAREVLENGINGVKSLTSSGKIRLVRERLKISKDGNSN